MDNESFAGRGKSEVGAPLGARGWFKCGGTADLLYKPADLEDLQAFLAAQPPPSNFPPSSEGKASLKSSLRLRGEDLGGGFLQAAPQIHIFGALSNTIIRDGGLPGVTIRLGREFSGIEADGDTVKAGALALDANVAQVAAEAGLAGLEFFSGIPGTIGGALRMNAGCYGTETKDVLIECEAIDRCGNLHILTPARHPGESRDPARPGEDPGLGRDEAAKNRMNMTYRHNDAPDDIIFVSATFKGQKDSASNVLNRMAEIKVKREASQPIREKTGGSTFANPSIEDLASAGQPEGTKVWQLIDAVGGRGLKIGGALMSEKHCNFMINDGTATAADLEFLGEDLIRRVHEKFGLTLRWEIRRVGRS